jgi:hypothetical protein
MMFADGLVAAASEAESRDGGYGETLEEEDRRRVLH